MSAEKETSGAVGVEPRVKYELLSHGKKGWVAADGSDNPAPVFKTIQEAYDHLHWLHDGYFEMVVRGAA